MPIYIKDLRVLIGGIYHDKSKDRIKIYPKYTKISSNLQNINISEGYRQTRRNILRNLENKKNFIFESCTHKNMIIDFYNQVMSRSNILTDNTIKKVSMIVDYALEFNGSILQIRDSIKIKYHI